MDQGHSILQHAAESILPQKSLPAKEPFALFSALQAKNHSSVALMKMIPFLTDKERENASVAFGSYVKIDQNPWNNTFALFLTHQSTTDIHDQRPCTDRFPYENFALKHGKCSGSLLCSYKDPSYCRLIVESSIATSSRHLLAVVFVHFPHNPEFPEEEVRAFFSAILEIADYTKKVKNWIFSFGSRTCFNFSAENQSLPSIIGALLSCKEFYPENLLDALVLNQDDIYDYLIEAIIAFNVRERPEHMEKFANLKLDKIKFLFKCSGRRDLQKEVNIQPAQYCDYFALDANRSNVLSETLSFDFQGNAKIQSIKLNYDDRDINFRLPGELGKKSIMGDPCELRTLEFHNYEMENFDFIRINHRLYPNLTKLKIMVMKTTGTLNCGSFPNLRELIIANLHPKATIILPSTKSEPRYLKRLGLAYCRGTIELGVDDSNFRGIPVRCCPLAVELTGSCDTRKMADLLTLSKKVSLVFPKTENCQEWPQFLVTDTTMPYPKKTVEEYSNSKVEKLRFSGTTHEDNARNIWCLPLGNTHLTDLTCENIHVKIDGNMFPELRHLSLEVCFVILVGGFARLESLIVSQSEIAEPWVLAAPSLNKLVFYDVMRLRTLTITQESSPKLEKFKLIKRHGNDRQWPTMISDGPIFPELNDLDVNIAIDKHNLCCLNISSVSYLSIYLSADMLKILKNKTFRCVRASFQISSDDKTRKNAGIFHDMPFMPFVRRLFVRASHLYVRIGGDMNGLVELIATGKVGFAANVSCTKFKFIQLTNVMSSSEQSSYEEALRYPMFGQNVKCLYFSNFGIVKRVIPFPDTAITVPCFRKNASLIHHFPLFEARFISASPQSDTEDEEAPPSISVPSALHFLAMNGSQNQADRRGKKRLREAAETRLLPLQEGENDAAGIRPRQTLRLTSTVESPPSVAGDESPEASDSFFVSSFLNDSAFASDDDEVSFPVMP